VCHDARTGVSHVIANCDTEREAEEQPYAAGEDMKLVQKPDPSAADDIRRSNSPIEAASHCLCPAEGVNSLRKGWTSKLHIAPGSSRRERLPSLRVAHDRDKQYART
jgi:hypothetical protein